MFGVQYISIVSLIGRVLISLHGPSLEHISVLCYSVSGRSAVVVWSGVESMKTHCMVLNDLGALQAFLIMVALVA